MKNTGFVFTEKEIETLRLETKGVQSGLIHFNNAGASLMPNVVFEAMVGYLETETLRGGYETAELYEAGLAHFYDAAAQLIGAKPHEIAAAHSATAAWLAAFGSVNWQRGDVVLTCVAEYGTNYLTMLQFQQKYGIEIQVVPNDAFGQIDLAALETMMTDRVRMIAITHIPTNSGLVNPAAAVGLIARKYGVLYLLDACQSVGHLHLDVRELNCDFLSATGRKYLRAPRGTGFLFVAERRLSPSFHPPMIDLSSVKMLSPSSYQLRDDARRYEHFEGNIAGRWGLMVAIDYALSIGTKAIEARVTTLGRLLRERLATVERVQLHDIGEQQCGIVTFEVKGVHQQQVINTLKAHHIHTSAVSKTGSVLDMEARQLGEKVVRASVHYYNTIAEIEQLCDVLKTTDWGN